jgi:hypothetical protein
MIPFEIDINKVFENPKNPRFIRTPKFEDLKTSITEFPEMLKIRPIATDENFVALGGNMRLKAAKELGHKKVWIVVLSDLTAKQQEEFMIKDNQSYGQWDFDVLVDDFDKNDLTNWGFDSWAFENLEKETPNKPPEKPTTKPKKEVDDDYDDNVDKSNLSKTAESYLNSAIRQIVLAFDNETHTQTLEKLKAIGLKYDIEKDNSAVVLKLIEFYNSHENEKQ